MNLATDWLAALGYALAPWAMLMHELPWIAILAQLGLTFFATLLVHRIGTSILEKLTRPLPYSHRIVRDANRAGGMVVFLLLVQVVVRNAADTLTGISVVRHLSALALIAAITWLGLRCVRAITRTIIERNPADAPNNLQARRIQTQTKVLGRTAMVMIVLFGSGAALMTLPLLRQIGTSLLASAGVAGHVVGFAAKPVLGNLLAGMQIALTQPIRLDDVVSCRTNGDRSKRSPAPTSSSGCGTSAGWSFRCNGSSRILSRTGRAPHPTCSAPCCSGPTIGCPSRPCAARPSECAAMRRNGTAGCASRMWSRRASMQCRCVFWSAPPMPARLGICAAACERN